MGADHHGSDIRERENVRGACLARLGDEAFATVCDRQAGHLGPHSGFARMTWARDEVAAAQRQYLSGVTLEQIELATGDFSEALGDVVVGIAQASRGAVGVFVAQAGDRIRIVDIRVWHGGLDEARYSLATAKRCLVETLPDINGAQALLSEVPGALVTYGRSTDYRTDWGAEFVIERERALAVALGHWRLRRVEFPRLLADSCRGEMLTRDLVNVAGATTSVEFHFAYAWALACLALHQHEQSKGDSVSEQQPSQGRVVLYVERNINGEIQGDEYPLTTWPAQVVVVHADGRVGLEVTKPYSFHEYHEAVPYSAEPVDKTWHWPPRVPVEPVIGIGPSPVGGK